MFEAHMSAAGAEVVTSAQTEQREAFWEKSFLLAKLLGLFPVWTDFIFSGESKLLGYINGFSRFCMVA